MITEDYVSFKTAKLLKEKGFNECCLVKYKYAKEFNRYLRTTEYVDDNFKKYYYPCPTLQMAMKWLRKEHKIIPIILTGGHSQNPFYYWFRIDTTKEGKWEDAIYREDEKEFPTYEQACEAAIKYCLENLI